jgi:2-C-methyl-D-erythritol 4-phosphate cytidylyltransferase / 2-C-methyl-D-erythritol 2,4-cyclodiphosphate synthase
MSAGDVYVVVVAAGSSSRFGGDKLAADLRGRSVLARAVDAVRAPYPRAPLALVVRPEAVDEQRARWEREGTRVVAGGERRQDSVRNGVTALDPPDDSVVLIHDGARPFVPVSDVRAVADEARRSGAALLSAPIVDTIKRLASDGRVVATVAREGLVRALTPQAFKTSVLRRAWASAGQGSWTDEAALIESLGGAVQAVAGDPRNVKATHQEDLRVLESAFPSAVRIGQGLDIHPFQVGRRLVLCGVELPTETGLAGHSDADVALHAVTDAILGACGQDDIGHHFPPSDPRWRDADSAQFLRHAVHLASESGFQVVHCDLTILAERPRIAPYREAMRERLAALLGIVRDRANVKATTCEGLGFVGRGEGIMATAVVTLELG